MSIETVRITSPVSDDNPDGFIVINKSDFDPDQHALFDTEAAEPGMSAKELKAALTERGIEFKSNASKADLKALLDAAQ
jgi:hypothetical protein